MARCGCSGTVCSCVVTAGPNITVTGSGSAANPYIISSSGEAITVLDTPSVDMAISGSGTPGDPFIISSIVKLDPAAGNLIVPTANGLRLDCDAVTTCFAGGLIPLDTPTVDMTITGTGTTADPYVISATAVAGGGTVTTANTDTVTLSSGVTPLTADVKVSADPSNLLGVNPTDGLDVVLHHGCGLLGDGTLANPLFVDVNGSVWPWPNPISNSGAGRIYCEPNSGGLYVDPEKFTLVEHLVQRITGGNGASVEINTVATVGGGLTPSSVSGTFTVTNPSSQRSMQLAIEFGVHHLNMRVDGNGRTQAVIGCLIGATGAGGVSFALGAYMNAHEQWMHDSNDDAAEDIQFDTASWNVLQIPALPAAPIPFVLSPGGSVTFTIQGYVTLASYNGDTQLGYDVFARVTGWSL